MPPQCGSTRPVCDVTSDDVTRRLRNSGLRRRAGGEQWMPTGCTSHVTTRVWYINANNYNRILLMRFVSFVELIS